MAKQQDLAVGYALFEYRRKELVFTAQRKFLVVKF
jgi:hypothetical protein